MTSYRVDIVFTLFFFLMIRRPPRSTLDRSSAASDVYKRQVFEPAEVFGVLAGLFQMDAEGLDEFAVLNPGGAGLSLIHISEPTRPY